MALISALSRRHGLLGNMRQLFFPHIWFSDDAGPGAGGKNGLILGVYQGESDENVLSPAAKKFDTQIEGKITELLKTSGKLFKRGDNMVLNSITKDFWSIALVGMGREKQGYNENEAIDEGMESARAASGLGTQLLRANGVTSISVDGFNYPEQAGEGGVLAAWDFQEFKDPMKWKSTPTFDLYQDPDAQSFLRGMFKSECQNLARRLSHTPANHMTPMHFAQMAVDELCPCGLLVFIRDTDWAKGKRLNGFLHVAKGSCEPPLVLEIQYCGAVDRSERPILICGKGVTFDSGGLCLKPCNKMDHYRASCCGASAIIGAMRAVGAMKLPINICCVIPLCENMTSGMAMKCGDIIQGYFNKNIMITNTDHEGHLVLADAMSYGQMEYKPRLVIDLGNLTKGARSALGSAASAVFCNSQTLWSQVRKAGVVTGDRVWRMPIWKFYKRKVTNFRSHDVDNQGQGYGEPCLGAAFLNEFINCVDWIHFDLAGTGKLSENKNYPYYTKKYMTGRPTRTLLQLLYQLACPAGKKE